MWVNSNYLENLKRTKSHYNSLVNLGGEEFTCIAIEGVGDTCVNIRLICPISRK